MTHSYMWHDSEYRRACSNTRNTTVSVCMHVTWLIRMYYMTYTYAWHVPSICVTWLWAGPYSNTRNTTVSVFMCVTWLIRMNHMTSRCVWHDPSICVTCLWAGPCSNTRNTSASVSRVRNVGWPRPHLLLPLYPGVQTSPTHTQKNPLHTQKSPIHTQKSPVNPLKSATYQ